MPDETKTDQPAATPEPTGSVATGADEGGDSGQAGGDDPSVAPAGSGNGAAVPATPESNGPPPVHVAIASVIAQLPSIEKGDTAPQEMGGYAYRGIERIMTAAGPALARAGIIFYGQHRLTNYEAAPPGWERNNRTHRVWTETTWTVVGPAGDVLDPPPVTQAMALDSSDKALNKAHTQSKKYMMMDLLQIGEKIADADGATFDPGPEAQPPQTDDNPIISEVQFQELTARTKKLPEDQRRELAGEWMQEDPMTGQPLLPIDDEKNLPAFRKLRKNDVQVVEAMLLRLEKAARGEAEGLQARAERLAARATGTESAEPAQEAAGAPAADADAAPAAETGDGDSGPAPGDPSNPVPEGTKVIWNGEPLPDLADEPNNVLSDRLRALAGALADNAWETAAVADVKGLHHSKVDAEIKRAEGQSIAEGEHIDHRRMRCYLVRAMVEIIRRRTAETGDSDAS